MREEGTNNQWKGLNRVDSNSELIIELQDDIFILKEDQLRTPVEEDFEYEIMIDASETERLLFALPSNSIINCLNIIVKEYIYLDIKMETMRMISIFVRKQEPTLTITRSSGNFKR